MADNPQVAGARPRPLSPFVTIYHWPITMATSIAHRVTGVGLAIGTLLVAWWLIATASGPETFQFFNSLAATPLGQLVLFGFVLSLSYHFLAGIRHLAWDVGYGFGLKSANGWSVAIILLSVLIAVGFFAAAWFGLGGYLQ